MHPDKMMGLVPEKRVTIDERWFSALKLAVWRSHVAWNIVTKQAEQILARCAHVPFCEGKKSETEPCHPDCPDRETRLSSLVILNAARQFAPIDAKKVADAPYLAPSREYFSEILSALVVAQAQLEACTPPPPPENPSLEEKNA
jgi:hypothetical protein